MIDVRRIDGEEPSCGKAGNREDGVHRQKGYQDHADASNRSFPGVTHIADVEDPCGRDRRGGGIEDEIESGVHHIMLDAPEPVKGPAEDIHNNHPHIEKYHCVEHLMLCKNLLMVIIGVDINHEKNNQ